MTEDRDQAAAAEPANGLEEESQRLEWAEEAVQQAVRSAENQGPAMQHMAHAVLQVLKYAAQLGIHLNELTDAVTGREAGAAYVGGEMAALGEMLDRVGPLLAAGPEEIAGRLEAVKAGLPYLDPAPQTVQGTTHQSTLMIPFAEVPRLVAAANTAGLTVVEFATEAILDAIAAIEQGKSK
jgi:hypothetical protein